MNIENEVKYLRGFVTEDKNILFEKILSMRTDYISIVLEDLYQSHNQSAVMRTADCVGLQDIHIIENRNVYDETSTVDRGAKGWLNLFRYNEKTNNSLTAINALKEKGYRIVATSPHKDAYSYEDIPLDKGKLAIFFGTEKKGLSKYVLDNADDMIKIPMRGFTESLNVSVSAALIMYGIVERLMKTDIDWRLSNRRKMEILHQWYSHSIKASEEILGRFRGYR